MLQRFDSSLDRAADEAAEDGDLDPVLESGILRPARIALRIRWIDPSGTHEPSTDASDVAANDADDPDLRSERIGETIDAGAADDAVAAAASPMDDVTSHPSEDPAASEASAVEEDAARSLDETTIPSDADPGFTSEAEEQDDQGPSFDSAAVDNEPRVSAESAPFGSIETGTGDSAAADDDLEARFAADQGPETDFDGDRAAEEATEANASPLDPAGVSTDEGRRGMESLDPEPESESEPTARDDHKLPEGTASATTAASRFDSLVESDDPRLASAPFEHPGNTPIFRSNLPVGGVEEGDAAGLARASAETDTDARSQEPPAGPPPRLPLVAATDLGVLPAVADLSRATLPRGFAPTGDTDVVTDRPPRTTGEVATVAPADAASAPVPPPLPADGPRVVPPALPPALPPDARRGTSRPGVRTGPPPRPANVTQPGVRPLGPDDAPRAELPGGPFAAAAAAPQSSSGFPSDGTGTLSAAAPAPAFAPMAAAPVGAQNHAAAQPAASPPDHAASVNASGDDADLASLMSDILASEAAAASSNEQHAAQPQVRKCVRPWYDEVFDHTWLKLLPERFHRRTLREVDFLLSRLELAHGARILDLCCGHGRHTLELAQRGYQMLGLDLSMPLLTRAAEEAGRRQLAIKFAHGDMRELPFENLFDGVVNFDTSFGYFDDRENFQVIQGVFRALKPGGRFVIEVTNRDWIVNQVPRRMWWETGDAILMEDSGFDHRTSRLLLTRTLMMDPEPPWEQDIDLRVYSAHELSILLQMAGFRVMELSGDLATPGAFFGPFSRHIVMVAEKPVV